MGWTLAALLTALLIGLTVQDHRSRDAALDADIASLSANASASVELALSQAVRQLEVTAVQLLAGEVDRAVLEEATPFTAAPVSAVIDADERRILGVNLDIPDVDVTLDLALQFLPELQLALDGRTAIGTFPVGDAASPIGNAASRFASIAVPFRAEDGSRRVFATGFDLVGSPIAEALSSNVAGVDHRIVDGNGQVVLSGAAEPLDDERVDRGAATAVEGSPWQVQTRAVTSAYQPSHTNPLNSIWLQLMLIVVGMAGVTWLWTRSVLAQEELERSFDQLERAGHHQREATAIVAHELRTPVTRALGMTSILTTRRDQLSEEQLDDMLSRAHRSTEALARLLDDLQVVVEQSSAVIEGVRAPVPVTELLASATRSLNGEAQLDLSDVTPGLHALVNEPLAVRVLHAVIDNARTHGGGRVEVSARRQAGEIRIEVRDHGPGIEPTYVDQLFAPFTQGSSHLDRQRGGLGVGLAVARNLAGGMGGRITYEPANPGARFAIHLPAAERAPSGPD